MATNEPTKAWRVPNWGSYTGSPLATALRQTFDNLSEFLAHPTFANGIKVGDGTPDSKDENGTVTPAPVVEVTIPTVTQPNAATLAILDDLDARATAIETNPIPFTRITDVSISTPMLQANSVTAANLAAINLSVGKFIRSSNYVAGQSGWAIDGDGTFEATNGIFRGNVRTGTGPDRVEINTSPGFRVSFIRNNVQVGSIDGIPALGGASAGISIFATDVNFSGHVRATLDLHGNDLRMRGQAYVGEGASFGLVQLGPGARVYSGGVARVQTQDTVGNVCNIRVASVEYTGGLVFVSDRAVKKNISISNSKALSKIVDTPIYEWEYDADKTPTTDTERHLGPMLDEVPEEWKVDGDRIDLNSWVATLHKAVQELANGR